MDHISTCRFFSFPIENKNKKANQILTGAGSFFIPIGRDRSNNSNFVGGYGIWGGIDRFEPPDILKKYKNTKMGFLIGHGEVLPNNKNTVTLSKEKDQYDIHILYLSSLFFRKPIASP